MRALRTSAILMILLMIVSSFTIVTPLDTEAVWIEKPQDKIHDSLLSKTTTSDEVDALVGYSSGLTDIQLQNAKSFAEKYADVVQVYKDLNMMRVKIVGTSILDLARFSFIEHIWPNEALDVKPTASTSGSTLAEDEYESLTEVVGAKNLWDMGYNGSGIVLAVLDTGVDSGHPDLDDFDDNSSTSDTKVAAYASFVEADSLPTDILGPGSYAASIAAGTGNASDGRYSGIAPGATILAGKVTLGGILALPSWIVSGIEWASTNGADIILLPFNTFGAPNDAVAQAVKAAVERGIFVVAAAGDDGPDYLTIMSPGGGLECFTVGAYDTINQKIPDFSGRGPSLSMNTKPDLVAPGVGAVGARIGAGLGGFGLGDIDLGGLGGLGGLFGGSTGENIDDYYKVADTTAAAAAVVAGAAALLMEAFDRATPIVIGNVLRDTATVLPYGANDAGAGLLNLPAAFSYLSARQDPIDPHTRSTGSALLSFGFLSASGTNASSTLMMSSYGTSTLVIDSRGGSFDIHMLMGTLYLKWNDMEPTSLMSFNVKREMHSVTLAGLTGLLGGLLGGADVGDLGGLGGFGNLGGLLGQQEEDTGYGRYVGVLSYEDEIFVTLLVESYNFTVNSTLPLTAFKITPFILNMGQGLVENVSLYLSYSLDLFGDGEDDHGKYSLNNHELFAYGISEDFRDFYIGVNSSREFDGFEIGNSSEISSHITDDNLTGSTSFDGNVGLGMKWDFGRIYPGNPVNVSIAMGFGENRSVLDASLDAIWEAAPPPSYAEQGDFILVEAKIPRTARIGETYQSTAIIMNIGVKTSDALAGLVLVKENDGTGTIFGEYATFDEIKPFHTELVHAEWSPEENGIHTAFWISTIGIESLTGIITGLFSLQGLSSLTTTIVSILDDFVQRDVFVANPISSASVFPKILPFAPFDVRFPTDFGLYTIMLSTTLDLGNMTVKNVGNASKWGNATLTPVDSVTGIYNFSMFVLVPPITMDGYHRCDYVLETEHGWSTNVTLERVVEYPRSMVMLDTSHGGGFGSLLGGGGMDFDIGLDAGNDTGGLPFPLAQDDEGGGMDISGFGDISDLGDITSLFDAFRMTTFSGLSNMEKRFAEHGIQILEIPGMALDGPLLSQVAAIMTIAPTESFNQSEIDAIRDYTVNGGKLIVLGDNDDNSNLTVLNSLLYEYGYFMRDEHTEENTTEIIEGSLLGSGVESMWLGGGTYIYNNQSQASIMLNGRSVALVDETRPEIVLFGSSKIFMNKNLVKCNNSIILDNMIQYLLGNTLTCTTSLAENTTLYEVGKSVYINCDIADYYGEPVNDLVVAVAFDLPNGNQSFFIAGFVENGLYSTQFTPSYWKEEGRINAIFIILRGDYAGTYASISFDFYKPDATNTTSGPAPLLNLVQVAYITSFGIFGALIATLYWSRKRRGKRYRIPEIDTVLGQDIDNTLNMLMAVISMMNELINRDDVDRIQKIEAMRGIMEDLVRAQQHFDDDSERIGGF